MNATAATLSAYARLYGTDAAGTHYNLTPGIDALPAQFAALRIGAPGDLARVDRFIDQLAGSHRMALRLRDAVKRESTATPGVGTN